MLLATGVWRAPSSYADALKWLASRDGFHLVTRDEKEDAVFVVVGVHGRSALAKAQSTAKRHVEEALVKAVGNVGTKL
jgi:hypothetical protein